MDNKGELPLPYIIAHLVSLYLLNTNRIPKAIETCKELLFLLKHKQPENADGKCILKILASLEKTPAIEEKIGDRETELRSIFESVGEHVKAKEYQENAKHDERQTKPIRSASVLPFPVKFEKSIDTEIRDRESCSNLNPRTRYAIESIVKKERNCVCLYISESQKFMYLWVFKADHSVPIQFKPVEKSKKIQHLCQKGPGKSVADIFCSEIYRKVKRLDPGQCEDRSWLPSNTFPEHTQKLPQENDCRLAEPEEYQDEEAITFSNAYKMIIAPVIDILDKPEIILFPDRNLFKLPFAALNDGEKGAYLSDTFRIRYYPSLTTLQLIQDCPTDYHCQTGVLILGDPDVGKVLYWHKEFEPKSLPFAREEAKMVAQKVGAQPLLGKEATKQAVLDTIESKSLVHIACHGDAHRGELLLAPPHLTGGRMPEEKDYLLTEDDVSRFQLRAKLVVLSCCHSAEGQVKAEGVVGIARTFLGSGARAVLVALWAIEDEATMKFMSHFYDCLVKKISASESLQRTMRWMRGNGFGEISQWAPFLLIGDNVTLDFDKIREASHDETTETKPKE